MNIKIIEKEKISLKDQFFNILRKRNNKPCTEHSILLYREEINNFFIKISIDFNFTIKREGSTLTISPADMTSLYVLKGVLSD